MFNIRNHAQFIGTVAADPVTRQEPDGATIVSYVLACQDNFLKKDGSPSVQHVTVEQVFPPDAADPGPVLKKDDLAYVSAQIASQQWLSSDGNELSSLKILADVIEIITPAPGKEESD